MSAHDLDLIRFVKTCDSLRHVIEEDLAELVKTGDPALEAALRERAEHAAAAGLRMKAELDALRSLVFGADGPDRVHSTTAAAPRKVRAHDRRKVRR